MPFVTFSNNVKDKGDSFLITYVSLFFVHIAAPGHAQICMSLKEEKNKKKTCNIGIKMRNKKWYKISVCVMFLINVILFSRWFRLELNAYKWVSQTPPPSPRPPSPSGWRWVWLWDTTKSKWSSYPCFPSATCLGPNALDPFDPLLLKPLKAPRSSAQGLFECVYTLGTQTALYGQPDVGSSADNCVFVQNQKKKDKMNPRTTFRCM